MAKLTKKQLKDLEAIGITDAKTVEEAEEKMKAFLASEGIDDLNEDFDDLYEMASIMYPDSEQQSDDLADEVDDEEEEDEDLEEDDDVEDDEDLEEEEDDLEEEDEEEEKPKSKPKKQVTKKAAPKKAASKKSTTPKASSRLNPKESKKDAEKYGGLIEAIKKLAPKSDFDFNFIANGGLTVKFIGDNSKRVFFSFDSPKVKEGEILARVYFPSIRDEEKLTEIFGEDYEMKADWSTNILVHDVKLEDFTDIMKSKKTELQAVLGGLGKKDEKLGKNRQKMEDDLKKSRKDKVAEAKASTSKKKAEKATTKSTPKKATTTKKTSKK